VGGYRVYSQLNADSNTIWPTKCLPFLSFELGRLGSENCWERESNMGVGTRQVTGRRESESYGSSKWQWVDEKTESTSSYLEITALRLYTRTYCCQMCHFNYIKVI